MSGRQPYLPVDVTLGLAPYITMAPNTSKFVQKMQECAKWAQKKPEAFQSKEAQWQQRSYIKKKQDSGLGGWGHGPSPCNCLQGLSQNTGSMGK